MNECFIKKKHAKNPKGDTRADKSIRGWVLSDIPVISVFAEAVDEFRKTIRFPEFHTKRVGFSVTANLTNDQTARNQWVCR